MRRMCKSRLTGSWKARALLALALISTFTGLSDHRSVDAHPLGNFTVNQYTRIEVASEGIRLIYVLDMAEIPAFQERQEIDVNGDGTVDESESAAYLETTVPEILSKLDLAIGANQINLVPITRDSHCCVYASSCNLRPPTRSLPPLRTLLSATITRPTGWVGARSL
jgi:hypothetical protein